MSDECMLSTIDNPYNPFDDFIRWRLFDLEKGYQSCERLAKFVNLSDDMTQKEINEEIERAIDEIIFYDPFNVYKKVRRSEASA